MYKEGKLHLSFQVAFLLDTKAMTTANYISAKLALTMQNKRASVGFIFK